MTKDPKFNPGANAANILKSSSSWPWPWPEPTPLEAIELAEKELSALCRVTKTFKMCIPVEPTDTDIIIGEALRCGRRAILRVAELEAELAALRPVANRPPAEVTETRYPEAHK
jgi:hypothetical protein